MKNIYKILATIAASAALFSCQKTEPVFQIENDVLSVDCTEQNVQQFIKCSGAWNVDCSEVDWITVTPESGTGNGVDFESYTLNIEYNSGAERTGTYYVISNGQKLSVAVTQAACAFAYGELSFSGNLAAGVESTATLKLLYECASGKESVTFTGKVTSEKVTGVTVPEFVYDKFLKGKGEIEIPVVGKPKGSGKIQIELFADGKSVGTVEKVVAADANLPEGLTVGWNFYATETNTTDLCLASKYNYSWGAGSQVDPSTLPIHQHRVLPTYGNGDAYLTVVGPNVANWTFNPSIQANGMLVNDYWLCVMPVRNVKPTHKVTFEAAAGGAGSGPGYYVIEYSADGTNWIEAPGATTMTFGTKSGPVHVYATPENASGDRKKYDKATDTSYRKYEFALSGINPIADGTIYFRMRLSIDLRINPGENFLGIGSGKWGDMKGIEINFVEE